MSKTLTILICIFCVLEMNVRAQRAWTINFKPALSFPFNGRNGSHSKTGYGFDVQVGYPFSKHFTGVAGWGTNTFPADKAQRQVITGYEESRFAAGLEFSLPLGSSSVNWRAGADGLLLHLTSELSNTNTNQSCKATGWRVNTGLSYPLADRVTIAPGFAYTYITGRSKDDEGQILLKYLSLNFKISYSLNKTKFAKQTSYENDTYLN